MRFFGSRSSPLNDGSISDVIQSAAKNLSYVSFATLVREILRLAELASE